MQIFEVAAFSADPAAGSPTGVVLDADDLSEAQMRQIAQQLNYSHTAFVSADQGDSIHIRFITPTSEIKNCGHATIAAHYLRTKRREIRGDYRVQQHTLSGVQTVEVSQSEGQISVYFRQNAAVFSAVEPDILAELLRILKITVTDHPVIIASPGTERYLLSLPSAAALHSLNPDFSALKTFCEQQASLGCFAYAMMSADEAVARMFAPAIGIDEDLINGNSSGCLGAYLLHLNGADELRLRVHQGHKFNRPGTVQVDVRRSSTGIETWVGGTAVIVGK